MLVSGLHTHRLLYLWDEILFDCPENKPTNLQLYSHFQTAYPRYNLPEPRTLASKHRLRLAAYQGLIAQLWKPRRNKLLMSLFRKPQHKSMKRHRTTACRHECLNNSSQEVYELVKMVNHSGHPCVSHGEPRPRSAHTLGQEWAAQLVLMTPALLLLKAELR